MPMESLGRAYELTKAGRFADALRVCDDASPNLAREDRQAADVLRVDLLEQIGRYAASA